MAEIRIEQEQSGQPRKSTDLTEESSKEGEVLKRINGFANVGDVIEGNRKILDQTIVLGLSRICLSHFRLYMRRREPVPPSWPYVLDSQVCLLLFKLIWRGEENKDSLYQYLKDH